MRRLRCLAAGPSRGAKARSVAGEAHALRCLAEVARAWSPAVRGGAVR